MPNYDLDRLGPEEFQRLFQALLKVVIAPGTVTFGQGPDGGREAVYQGKAFYPSKAEPWDGVWIFQAKFHDVRQLGPDKARRAILNDLKTELEKICIKYKRKCDNYILATNVALSSVSDAGTHDKITQEIIPEFIEKVSHVHVWGYDELARFLDVHPNVRQSFLHLIVSGDLVAELMDQRALKKSSLAEEVELYLSTSFQRDQYALLDQAGEVGEKPMPLRRVFIDLDLKPRSEKDLRFFSKDSPDLAHQLHILLRSESIPATEVLVRHDIPKSVLIGGPGQGKSTLGQFIAQIHRGCLLKQAESVEEGKQILPTRVRVPFRVSLKDYAQWIADSQGSKNLETYLATLVEECAGRQVPSDHIQQIFKENPCVLILDGLDEVTDPKLRAQMLGLILEFIGRAELVLKTDLQIIATSRPAGYSDQFDPSRFLHLSLDRMYPTKVTEYTQRWIKAKALDPSKAMFLRSSIDDCLKDPHFSLLMNTPLQVTIFILIILNGGTPPRQREELFNEYLEVIYKRERSKSKTMIVTEKRLLFGLHQYIGYLLHRKAGESDTRSRMREDEFAREVLRYLRVNDPYSEVSTLRQKADQMIKEAQERLVLLVQLEQGYYGFELRSIQEFFAAGHLADTAFDNKERFSRFQAIALPAHWRNVALFFAGRVGRAYPGEAAHILEACRDIDRRPPDKLIKRGAWLAFEIAVDRSFGPNRILQRSAIEYAITLLDGDLDADKRDDFVSKVRELPGEDIRDHVIPLLSDKLSGMQLPHGLPVAETYGEVCEDRTIIEKIITRAYEQNLVDSLSLLKAALDFRLSPRYVIDTFRKIFQGLSNYELTDLLSRHFVRQSEAVIEILKELDPGGLVARSVFHDGLPFVWSYRSENVSFPDPIPENVVEQVKLAWSFARTITYLSREIDYSDFPHLRSLYRKGPEEKEVESARLTALDNSSALDKIVQNDSAIIELRVAALGLLSRISFYSASPDLFKSLEGVTKRFVNSVSTNELEFSEEIMYHLHAPSIESLQMLSELNQFDNPRRFLDFLRYSSHAARKPEGTRASLAYLTDACPQTTLTKFTGFPSKPRAKDDLPINLLRIGVRIGVMSSSSLINLELVENVLNHESELVLKLGGASWRTWETLKRMGLLKWRKSTNSRGIEKAIQSLCKSLEESIVHNPGHWEIGVLIPRIIETDLNRDLVKAVFAILAKMPPGPEWQRGSRVTYTWGLDKRTINAILEIALLSDGLQLEGAMKWFAATISDIVSDSEEPFPKISFEVKDILSRFDQLHGPSREGALLLLVHSQKLSIDDTKEILQFSTSELDWTEDAWAALVTNTAQRDDAGKVIPFLETVWSERTKYPETLRHAAISRYEQIAKTTTQDISDMEQELGLPFRALENSG